MTTNGNVPAAMAAGATGNLRAHVRGNRRATMNSDRLSRLERDILDLWDAGVSEGEIAIALELKPSLISRVLRTYVETHRELEADARGRAASEALLRAQIAAGQHELSDAQAYTVGVTLALGRIPLAAAAAA